LTGLATYPAQFSLLASGRVAAEAAGNANNAPARRTAPVAAIKERTRVVMDRSIGPLRKSHVGPREEDLMSSARAFYETFGRKRRAGERDAKLDQRQRGQTASSPNPWT